MTNGKLHLAGRNVFGDPRAMPRGNTEWKGLAGISRRKTLDRRQTRALRRFCENARRVTPCQSTAQPRIALEASWGRRGRIVSTCAARDGAGNR